MLASSSARPTWFSGKLSQSFHTMVMLAKKNHHHHYCNDNDDNDDDDHHYKRLRLDNDN